mgnify:CR=1 FL=1
MGITTNIDPIKTQSMHTMEEDITTTLDKLCTLLQYSNSEVAEDTYNLVAAAKKMWEKNQVPKE